MGKKLKKIISMILLLSQVSLLGGCKMPAKGDSSNRYGEFMTITVFDSLGNYDGIQSGWFAKVVKDKFNMELNIISPNQAEDGDSLYEDRFAAGNIADLIICGNEEGQLQNMADAGLVVDMRPYLMNSNLMERFSEAVYDLNDSINKADPAAIYGIPTSISNAGALAPADENTPNYGAYLRYDLYQQLGCPPIETLEDILDVTEAMKAIAPTADDGSQTYGFSLFADWDGNLAVFAKQLCCFYGYDELGFALISGDGTQYQDVLDRKGLYYRSLRFYHEAFKRGLLDPDSGKQGYWDTFNKTKTGQILFSTWPWVGQTAYNSEEHLNAGKAMMFIPIADEKIYTYGTNAMGKTDVIVAVGSQAPDIARVVDFVEWLYSSEGISIACAQRSKKTAGPMGLTWEMSEEGPVLTEWGKKALLGGGDVAMPEEWGEGTWAEGICQLNFTPVLDTQLDENGYSYYYEHWDSVKALSKTPIEQAWSKQYQTVTVMDYIREHDQMAFAPVTTVKKERETAELATIRKQCANTVTTYSWRMIFADTDEEFDTLFDEMVLRATDSGYEKIYAYDLECAKAEGAARQAILAEAMKDSTGR